MCHWTPTPTRSVAVPAASSRLLLLVLLLPWPLPPRRATRGSPAVRRGRSDDVLGRERARAVEHRLEDDDVHGAHAFAAADSVDLAVAFVVGLRRFSPVRSWSPSRSPRWESENGGSNPPARLVAPAATD